MSFEECELLVRGAVDKIDKKIKLQIELIILKSKLL